MNLFKKVWHHLRRTPYQSLAAMLVMFFNFLLISAVVFVFFGLGSTLKYFETRPEITAFILDQADTEEVNQLIDSLKKKESIKEVNYVSKEEALKIYQEENKDDPLLLEMVTAEILPASLEISADEAEVLKSVAADLKNKPEIFEEVVFQQDVVDTLLRWTRVGERIGIGLIVFLTLVSVVAISVIIGMKITLRKKEVSVLNLLGAGQGYIRSPFLVEGAIYGLLGALFGWGISLLAVFYLRPKMNAFFGEIPFWPATVYPFFLVLAGEMVFGAMIGVLSSWIAVRKHLRR